MTHDELLERLDELKYDVGDSGMNEEYKAIYALRAVVELHKPIELNVGDEFHYEGCLQCDRQYPCPTIQQIIENLK